MATNSSPARIVRESIETPASRARGSRAGPRFPATASATCVTVHRIVASEHLLVSGFGRGVHLVRTALLGAFSPVEGSSLIYESFLWPVRRAGRFDARGPERITCPTCSAFWQLTLTADRRMPRELRAFKQGHVSQPFSPPSGQPSYPRSCSAFCASSRSSK